MFRLFDFIRLFANGHSLPLDLLHRLEDNGMNPAFMLGSAMAPALAYGLLARAQIALYGLAGPFALLLFSMRRTCLRWSLVQRGWETHGEDMNSTHELQPSPV